MLQQAYEAGHDIEAATRTMVTEVPLGVSPAGDLRYRIVASLDFPAETGKNVTFVPPTQRTPSSKEPRTDQRDLHEEPGRQPRSHQR